MRMATAIYLIFALLAFPQGLFGFTNSRPNEIPPLRPPHGEIPPTFFEQHSSLVVVSGLGLLALLCAGIFFVRRTRPHVTVPPEVQARATLESIRNKVETGAVLSTVSRSLRRYIIAAFKLPPEELTTTEFCNLIAGNNSIGPELAGEISDLLQRGDERKFRISADPQPLGAVSQAFRIIEICEGRLTELHSRQQKSEPAS